jgi:hypothetical protein
MKKTPISTFRYPLSWQIRMLFFTYTGVPLLTILAVNDGSHLGMFLWFILLFVYCISIISIFLVSDTVIYEDRIASSFLGIHLRSIKIGSICEIRKTMVYDRWEQEYCEELSIRTRGAPKKDGLSGIFNTIRISANLRKLQEFKMCLMDVSSSNNIPMTFVDPRSTPVGRGPEAFTRPLHVSEL